MAPLRPHPSPTSSTRSTAVGLVLICGISAVGVFAWRDLQSVFHETDQMGVAIREGFEVIGRLQFHTGETRRTVLYALGTQDANEQVRFAQHARAAGAEVDRILGQPQLSPVTYHDLTRAWVEYLRVRDDVIGLLLEGEVRQGVNLDLNEGTRLFERVELELDGVSRAFEAHALQRAASIDAQISRTLGRVGLLCVVSLVGILSTVLLYHRRLTADRVHEAETRRIELLEMVVDAVISTDDHDVVVEVNSSAARMFATSPEGLVGCLLDRLVSIDGQPRGGFSASTLAARCQAAPDQRLDAVGHRSDGTTFPVEMRLVTHATPAGARVTAHLRDVTDRRHAEDELRRAKLAAENAARARSDFVTTISHEIRTPLNVLIGMTSLLADSPLTHEQRTWVAAGRAGGEAVLSVINNVLDWARLESAQLELDPQPADVRTLVDEVVSVFALSTAKKQVSLEGTVDASIPVLVVLDPSRLRQVLLNLVGNAVKFTHKGGIVLRASASPIDGSSDMMLRFEVADTGIGITDEQRPHLFEAFHQGDASTSRRFGGSGLGLAISRRLARLLGGDLDLESGPGVGSTFIVTVRANTLHADDGADPDAWCAAAELGEQGFSAELGHAYPLQVLVVDDDEASRTVAAGLLAHFGYQADLASTGTEALWMTASTPYDLVLMDLQMPWPDGIEVARLIRSRAPASPAPRIVALTANVSADDRERSAAAGMGAYLTKPVRIDDLRAVLTQTALGAVTRGTAPVRTART